MQRCGWFLVLASAAMIGCGSGSAHQVKGDPPVSKSPSIAESEDEIQLASNETDGVPEHFWVKFETTAGDFIVEVHKSWAPIGVERFHELVKEKVYDGCKFFRVIQKPEPFMVQFGIPADPEVAKKWRDAKIEDDPVRYSNVKGRITFATSGPDSRTSQVFVNYGKNTFLDERGFAPFGQVIEGMEVVEALNSEYGGGPSEDQAQIQRLGNQFLEKKYPNLDGIISAKFVSKPASATSAAAKK